MLSVIIPTYNTASMTLRCCRAVLAQLPRDAEVIVVDDGSTDGTQQTMPAEVRVVRLERNSGFAVAANAGVAAARGDLLLILNSDALVQEGALQTMIDAFADERLGIAGAQLVNEDGSAQWSGGRTPTLMWMIGVVSGLGRFARLVRRRKTSARSEVDWVSGAAMMLRRQVWKDAGPFNETYRFYCQDLELCLRARERGWEVRVIEEARVVHGLGKTIQRGPELLWSDLLTWGRAYYGSRWGAFARVVLTLVAALRLRRLS